METLKNEALGIIGLGEDGVISKAQDAVGNAGADFLEGFTGAAKDRQARNASFEKQMAEAQAKLAEALKQRETLAGSPLVPGAALAAPVTNDTKIEFHQSNSIYTSDTNASLDGAASSGAQQIAKAMSNAVRQ